MFYLHILTAGVVGICAWASDGQGWCTNVEVSPGRYEIPLKDVARVCSCYPDERGTGWGSVCWEGHQRIRRGPNRQTLTVGTAGMRRC